MARLLFMAALSNLLNQKLTIFFFPFLPQFVPPHAPHELQTLLLPGGKLMAMTFVVFSVYAVAASALCRYVIGRPRGIQNVPRTSAATFVGLGVKLALTSR